MEWNKAKKFALLAVLLMLAAVLAACTVSPDKTGDGPNTDPFPVMGQQTDTPAPSATIESIITLPSESPLITEPSPGVWGNVLTSQEPFLSPTPWGGILTVTGSPGPEVSPSPTPMILKLGAKGPTVKTLQQRLKALGYNVGSADGDFGKDTENAVKAFQARNGLSPDGIAGTQTLNKLNSSSALPPRPTATPTPRPTATPRINQNLYLQKGSSGADVRRMQERLIALGYLGGKASGRFDDATFDAIYAFQQRNVSYADGIAGPMTLEKLYSSSAKRASTTQGVIGVTLERGTMDSDAVRSVQSKLKQLGYYNGGIDGDFGATTESAVKAFQAANNLTVDGKVGQGTSNRLFGNNALPSGGGQSGQAAPTRIPSYTNVTPNPYGNYVTLQEGNSGQLVRALQQALKNQGYYTGTVDGLFGFSTTQAVIAFQKSKGLSQDGKAGAATQRILYEGNYPSGS